MATMKGKRSGSPWGTAVKKAQSQMRAPYRSESQKRQFSTAVAGFTTSMSQKKKSRAR